MEDPELDIAPVLVNVPPLWLRLPSLTMPREFVNAPPFTLSSPELVMVSVPELEDTPPSRLMNPEFENVVEVVLKPPVS